MKLYTLEQIKHMMSEVDEARTEGGMHEVGYKQAVLEMNNYILTKMNPPKVVSTEEKENTSDIPTDKSGS